MPDFTPNDIDQAKRRVQQMHSMAHSYVDDSENTPPKDKKPNNFVSDILSSLSSSNDSALIIALILILSREQADNMLIFALLYILL